MDRWYAQKLCYNQCYANSTSGPPLPLSLIGAQMLTNPEGDGVLVLGGKEESNAKTDKIFKLTCSLDGQCVWTRLDKNLQVARSAFVAMWIPDVLVNCSV